MNLSDWICWVASITRAVRVDDEEPDLELCLAPWWQWKYVFERRYGVEVERKIPARPGLEYSALYSWEASPRCAALSDYCRDGCGVCHCLPEQ